MLNLEKYISDSLQNQGCVIITAHHRYVGNGFAFGQKLMPNMQNYEKLNNIVTKVMKSFQSDVADNLAKGIYVDCNHKSDQNIMIYILQNIIKKIGVENFDLAKALQKNSFLELMENQNFSEIDQIINNYSQSLIKLLAEHQPENQIKFMNFESEAIKNIIGKIMKSENIDNIYIYLDNIDNLTIAEQQQINNILFARGNITNGGSLKLVINNSKNKWKNYYTTAGHKAQAIHDYSELRIKEEEIL